MIPNGRIVDDADTWDSCGLLTVRCHRPGHHAAERRNELAPLHHSMTSSARASTGGGITIPNALAVLRLIVRANLVGCSIGKSPGFAPFSILSTKVADRLDNSWTG